MDSGILFMNSAKTVVLVDIPRSIELAQVEPPQRPRRHLLSCKPSETPWQGQASKKHREPALSQSPSAAIDELMTLDVVQRALQEVGQAYKGPWLLPRTTQDPEQGTTDDAKESRKRKQVATAEDHDGDDDLTPYIPSGSHHLLGSIESQRDTFVKSAPIFDLIVMDPPWPSRSVRRKRDRYNTAYDMKETQELLSLIPVAGHLKPEGLVAVWVTNKPAVLDLLRSPGGMFDQWGLEPIGEWIWVKITSKGEPIVGVESTWRKPWERLLISRKKGSSVKLPSERRVIFAVPDLHSRKPNLRVLFNEILSDGYPGLEIFSRSLTAGWWSWGDQTLMFQQKHRWIEQPADGEILKDSITTPQKLLVQL